MIKLHIFEHPDAQATALARAVCGALQARLASNAVAQATLAVSGGKSPTQFFQALSRTALAWSRINVTLADDRWVSADHPDSNVRLLRRLLLQNQARAARFIPLVDMRRKPSQQVDHHCLNTVLPDVVVLGMGEDGHIASLFSDACEWRQAMTTDQRFVWVQPGRAPHPRISLSLSALMQIPSCFLLIGGPSKLRVLKEAIAHPQPQRNARNAISELLKRFIPGDVARAQALAQFQSLASLAPLASAAPPQPSPDGAASVASNRSNVGDSDVLEVYWCAGG